jgi:hypothetical protein
MGKEYILLTLARPILNVIKRRAPLKVKLVDQDVSRINFIVLQTCPFRII